MPGVPILTPAPKHLSAATKRWWTAILEEFELNPADLRVLQLGAEAFDRAQQARLILKKEGITYEDRFGNPKKHPAVSVEENARLAYVRVVRELGLDGGPEPDPRLPRRSR
jgi:P27 family predicted phage terminase small subunit